MMKRKVVRRRLFGVVMMVVVVVVSWVLFVHSIIRGPIPRHSSTTTIDNNNMAVPPMLLRQPSPPPVVIVSAHDNDIPTPKSSLSPVHSQQRHHHHHGAASTDDAEAVGIDLHEPPIPTNVFTSKGGSPFPAATAPLDILTMGSSSGIGKGNGNSGITFMVLGDWGGPGRDPQRNVGAAMATVATRPRAEGGTSPHSTTPPLRQLLRPLVLHPSIKANEDVFTDITIAKLKHQLLHPDPVLHDAQQQLGEGSGPTYSGFCPIKQGSLESTPTTTNTGGDEVVRGYGTCQSDGHGDDGDGGVGMFPPRSLGGLQPSTATNTKSWLDFVVSTGDNMYEAGVADIRDRRFRRNFEEVYTHPSLHVPWLMSLGNHDHGAHGTLRDVQGQVNYSFVSPRWLLPSNYFRQTIRLFSSDNTTYPTISIEVFVLDTYDVSPSLTRISRAQLRWFEMSLSSSVADWRFVVGHRPLYSAGAKHGSSPSLHKLLYPLMAKYNVSAYFCGDDHQLQLMREGPVRGPHMLPTTTTNYNDPANIMYVLSGGGSRSKDELKKGGISRTIFQSAKHGFATVTVTDRYSLEVAFTDQHGVELHRSTIANRHLESPPPPV